MKKNRIILEIAVIIGTILPFIILYLLKGKTPFIEFDKYLLSSVFLSISLYVYPLYIYQKNVYTSFSTKINYWFRISWLLLSMAFGGFFLFHVLFPTSTLSSKAFFILFGIMAMMQGDYRFLFTKNSGIDKRIIDFISDENQYRKTQRKIGLLEFYSGIFMIVSCFIIPNTEENFISLITGISFITLIGTSVIINLKSNKQANK